MITIERYYTTPDQPAVKEIITAVEAGEDERGRPLPGQEGMWLVVARVASAAQLPDPPEGGVFPYDSPFWDHYALPLAPGVALLSQTEYERITAEAEQEKQQQAEARAAAEAQAQTDREQKLNSARAKLTALGLTVDEIQALVGG